MRSPRAAPPTLNGCRQRSSESRSSPERAEASAGVSPPPFSRRGGVYGTSRHGTGPDGTVALSVDHADDDAVAAAFARIVEETGRLDLLLVNNAWASPPGFAGFTAKFYERPVSDWDSLIGVGLRS